MGSVLGTHSRGIVLQVIKASWVATAQCLAADGWKLLGALVRTTDTAHVDAHLEQRLSREYLPLIYQAHTTSLPQHLTSVLNFWANANCDGGLEIKAFDSHSDAGCSLLNLRG